MHKGFILEGTRVECRDDNIEKSLRRFKKKVQDGGILMDLRDREGYLRPSLKKTRAKNQARRRWLQKLKNEQLAPKLY